MAMQCEKINSNLLSDLQWHPRPGPDDEGLVQSAGPAAVRPRLAVQVDPGHREARDQHREAAQQEDRAADSEAPPRDDEAVPVEDDHHQPDAQQSHPGDLGHLEGPGDVRHVVQDDVGQWRVLVHVRHPIVDHGHHHGRQPGHEQAVQHGDPQLPALGQRIRGDVWPVAMVAGAGSERSPGYQLGVLPAAAGLVRARDVERVGPLGGGLVTVVTRSPAPARWDGGVALRQTILGLSIREDEIILEWGYLIHESLYVSENFQLQWRLLEILFLNNNLF